MYLLMAYVFINAIDVKRLMIDVKWCHSDVLVDRKKLYLLCHVMDDRKYQMDEIQSGLLMVKSLTGRLFVKSKWLSG
jgi:hypothetical protein